MHRSLWGSRWMFLLPMIAAFGCIGIIEGGSEKGHSETGVEPHNDPTQPDTPADPIDPESPTTPPGTRIRRLTKLELINTIEDLLPGRGKLASDLESDARTRGFSTAAERSVTTGFADSLRRAAEAIASDFKTTLTEPAWEKSCFDSDAAAENCAKKFVNEFGARAFRRPLNDEDVQSLIAVYTAGRETGRDADPADRFRSGMDYTLRAILQAPDFIYLTELGDPAAANGTTTTLTTSEMASAISYSISASPPDAELLAAAQASGLSSSEQIAAQVRRLASARSDRTQAQLTRFVNEWLKIDFDNPVWVKDPAVQPLYSPELIAALAQESSLFLGDWIDSGATLENLLTSNTAFANATTSPLYGIASSSSTFERVTLNPAQRAGILTRAGFLGSNSRQDSSSPVRRGITIMERLLCRTPPQVPDNVPPLPEIDATQAQTTRQRFGLHSTVQFCSACHQEFEPLGNAFEMFDSLGAHRTTENGANVDTSGAIVGTAHDDGPVANAIELSNKLAASADVHACFSRQMLRYLLGRSETRFDVPTLDATKVSGPDELGVIDIIATIVASKSYSERTVAIDP